MCLKIHVCQTTAPWNTVKSVLHWLDVYVMVDRCVAPLLFYSTVGRLTMYIMIMSLTHLPITKIENTFRL